MCCYHKEKIFITHFGIVFRPIILMRLVGEKEKERKRMREREKKRNQRKSAPVLQLSLLTLPLPLPSPYFSLKVKAAVYAIKMVTAHSETFAQGTIRRIAPLLGSVSTSPEQKLQLVPLIQVIHTHFRSDLFIFVYIKLLITPLSLPQQEASHNPNMVKEARDIVTTFLSHAPSQPYLFSSLSSLHQLTTRSLFLVGEQVGLLVGVLEGELREGVRRWVVGLLGDLVPVAGPLYDYKAEVCSWLLYMLVSVTA